MVNPDRLTANGLNVPAWTRMALPGGAMSTACWMVRQGAASEPSALSAPPLATW
jgi:hypothetical protein